MGLSNRMSPAAGLALAGVFALASSPAATAASTAPLCAPPGLNVSAARAGGAVTVSPTPNSMDASYRTQISLVGVPASAITQISVVGSRSGPHSGTIAEYSQGDGGSFLPAAPFAEGEVVTVRATLQRAGRAQLFSWHFTTAEPDRVSRSLETPPGPPPPPNPSEFQHFASRPDLEPPRVTVTLDTGAQAPGDLLLAPYAGPGQYGPMILDGAGGLVWFKRLPAGTRAANLRAQIYEGRPVLSWWQDPLGTGARSGSAVVIVDSSYRPIATIRAGNGFQPDLHAFEITPRGTAVFTVYDPIRCNLSAYGGPADGAVADTLFQEIDLRTRLVRFEWHALDHVALTDSYMPPRPGSPRSPWDFFHINAVSRQAAAMLVDARNAWAAYEIDASSGQVLWTLGGKRSSFAMGPGAAPAWQHDAREGPGGTVSFFDNGGTPRVHAQSRAIVLQLDFEHKTANLVSSFTHLRPLLAASQGDFQPLSGGNWMVGWGQEPFLSEFSAAGRLLFEAHLPPAYQSFTVVKMPWSATPAEPPRVAVRSWAHGGVVAYASWNGATAVAYWRLLTGAQPRSMIPVATTPRQGFETRIAIPAVPRYAAVQALDEQGRILASSAVIRG
jgi:Arylsulfotransferase (ASST)